jgi:hypothetical protein
MMKSGPRAMIMARQELAGLDLSVVWPMLWLIGKTVPEMAKQYSQGFAHAWRAGELDPRWTTEVTELMQTATWNSGRGRCLRSYWRGGRRRRQRQCGGRALNDLRMHCRPGWALRRGFVDDVDCFRRRAITRRRQQLRWRASVRAVYPPMSVEERGMQSALHSP